MAKGGMPQQGGFGGGFGMPQQQGFGGFGGFGGGFGMPQQQQGFGGYGGGFGGGYQPSRQRFNQMPQQQQGFGDTFARTMPPQQQGLGGGLGSFFGRQGFNMPQRPMTYPMAPQQQQANQMMQPSGGRMVGPDPIMQQQQAQERERLRQQGITPIDPNDPTLVAAGQRYHQLDLENQANYYGQKQQMQPPQAPMTQSQAMAQMPMGGQQNMQNAFQQFQQAQMPMSGQPQSAAPMGMMGNLQGGPQAPLSQDQMQQRAQWMARVRQEVTPYNAGTPSTSGRYNQPGPQGGSFMQNLGMFGMQPRMPQAPTTQQVGQEDPRMQAMRMMQRMRFDGGGGGYNF